MTANFSPAVGTASRPETSTGVDGPASVDRAALVVEQGPDPAEAVAADDHVADVERAVLDEHGRDHARGPRRSTPPGRSRSPAGSGWP